MPAYAPIIPAARPNDATFEDSLRELAHSSPHIGFALAIHALLLLIFANMGGPPPEVEPTLAIITEPPQLVVPITPPKKLETEPEPIDPQTPVQDPIVEVFEADDSEEEFESTDASTGFSDSDIASELGIGSGSQGTPGDGTKFGPPGGEPGGPDLTQDNPLTRALRWLALHQNADGFWSAAAFDDECGEQGDDVLCDGAGNPQFDVGVTGLSLLAFLGAGQTTRHGEYRETVRSGLDYLRKIQSPLGNFGDERLGQHSYDHLIATLAMIEASARDPSKRALLRKPISNALAYTARLRSVGGAWRYAPDHPEMLDPARANDSSVTGWAILVLTSAKDIGLEVDAAALADALDFLDEVTDPLTGRTGYTALGENSARERGRGELWPAEQTEALTAVGVLSRIFADPLLERPRNLDRVVRGVERLDALPPVWDGENAGRVDFYYWYYGSYALYQFQEIDPRPFKHWNRELVTTLGRHQHLAGERRGSWDPQADPWGHLGGRVYATALLALTLEVGYRYDTVLSPR